MFAIRKNQGSSPTGVFLSMREVHQSCVKIARDAVEFLCNFPTDQLGTGAAEELPKQFKASCNEQSPANAMRVSLSGT